MDYELKKPLQVMNKEAGEYQGAKTIVVEFRGKKGLKTLKRLQDVIFKTLTQQSKGGSAKQDTEKEKENVTIEELLSILEMTGASEILFDEITGALRAFATIGEDGQKLDDTLQDEMEHEELDGLYQEVLKHFLLPKIILKMNIMNK